MEYYDLVGAGCSFSLEFASALGFSRVFVSGKDIAVISDNKDSPGRRYMAVGSNHSRLAHHARHGAVAIVVGDLEPEKVLMDTMRDSACAMAIPFGAILGAPGCGRYRAVRKASRLFSACRKSDIPVAFISMAESQLFMQSYMQLMSLAMLVGSDEAYARYSISHVNASLGGEDGSEG